MIPLKDDNPTRTFPIINYALIAANVAVFIYEVTLPPGASKAFLAANAMIPMRIPDVHEHVFAWRVDAPAGKHALPLYLRG